MGWLVWPSEQRSSAGRWKRARVLTAVGPSMPCCRRRARDMTIRVLVADDQDLVRTGLTMILRSQPDIDVVGEAADGRRAVALARQLRPDVCLLDIRMPGL